jgi:hypothetical protein
VICETSNCCIIFQNLLLPNNLLGQIFRTHSGFFLFLKSFINFQKIFGVGNVVLPRLPRWRGKTTLPRQLRVA